MYELYIYDLDIKLLGIVDKFKSFRMLRQWQDKGDFELVLGYEDLKILDLLAIDHLIVLKSHKDFCIIEAVEISNSGGQKVLTVRGSLGNSLLERRIILEEVEVFNQKPERVISDLVYAAIVASSNSARNMPRFVISALPNLGTADISVKTQYANLLDKVIQISKVAVIGFKTEIDVFNRTFIFSVVNPRDLTKTPVGDYTGNMIITDYIDSKERLKTFAIIGGEKDVDSGYHYIIEINKGETSFKRKEIYIDLASTAQDDESDQDYDDILREKGNEALEDYKEFKNITGDILKKYYLNPFDLGDKITAKSIALNIEEELIISEIELVLEKGIETIQFTLGSPIPEKDDLFDEN